MNKTHIVFKRYSQKYPLIWLKKLLVGSIMTITIHFTKVCNILYLKDREVYIMAGFFKRLLNRDTDEDYEEVDETTEDNEMEDDAPKSSKTQAETEEDAAQARIKAAEMNRADSIYKMYCKWCEYAGVTPMTDAFALWMKQTAFEGLDENIDKREFELNLETFRKSAITIAEKYMREITAAERTAEEERDALKKEHESAKREAEANLRDAKDALEAAQQKEDMDTAAAEEKVAACQKALDEVIARPIPEVKVVVPTIEPEVKVQIARGNMQAFITVFPPMGEAAEISNAAVDHALEDAGVKHGIKTDLLGSIVEDQQYFRIYTIAQGTAPVPGEDGKVEERVPREERLTFEEDEHKRVNYREMKLFRKIEEGSVICDIILPTEGTDGTDVKGANIKAPAGKKVEVPAGENTKMSDDGLTLISRKNGYVSYSRGKFNVREQLHIKGNIDLSVGNQDFLGDIVIDGDVLSGFTVKATGNIIVKGAVEAATLVAGGSITIGSGSNGNNHGQIRAGGSINGSFFENIILRAGEDIHAEALVLCDTCANGIVYATDGRGVIIGGSVEAGKAVKAREIGNRSNRRTELELGQITKDLDPEYVTEHEYRKSYVEADTIYPPTKLMIGGSYYTVETVNHKSKFYYGEDGEVKFGTF